MIRTLFFSALAAILVLGCDDPNSLTGRRRTNRASGDGTSEEGATSGDPTQPGTCAEGVAHPGFAQTDFVADRKAGALGEDRRRVKPFTALQTEFQRVLGAAPAGLTASAAAFGETPARWYSEPTAGAVSLSTTYSLAFTGCYDTMTDAKYAQAPTAATAETECAALQRKAWMRSPTPDETSACSDFVVGLTDETDARRLWAHACASVMTAAGFTTY